MTGTSERAGTVEWDLEDPHPTRLWVEGVALGIHTITAELWGIGYPAVSVDIIKFNVEPVVWPFASQQVEDWYTMDSSSWVGLRMAPAWYVSNALVDFIVTPANKGFIETIHPDKDGGKRASEDGDDSKSTETYKSNVTLDFKYEFSKRGVNNYGYVQADISNHGNADARNHVLDRVKLSFVGNSGIKFGSNKEINILDVDSMVSLAGGIGAFTLDVNKPLGPKGVDDQGNVDILRDVFGGLHDFEDEGISQLMTGVLYGDTEYGRFSDFTGIPAQSSDFIAALTSNMNRTDGHMQIVFNGAALTVKLDGTIVYFDANANLSLGQFLLQSHWGSGVRFTEMDTLVD